MSIVIVSNSAVALLKLIGHNGSVPGVLLAASIPAALSRLLQNLDTTKLVEGKSKSDADNTASPPRVEHAFRSWPLIQMLSMAADSQSDVTWE